MAGYNRHLRGERNEKLVDIHGNTVVEAGDLMFRASVGGMFGADISADNYAYPFDDALNSASETCSIIAGIHTTFLGVAMESSPSGVTEKISVASSGVFRYPLYKRGAVTLGATVSAVSTFTAASVAGVSKQTVYMASTTPGTTAYLGYIVKTESGASFVDFQLRTAYGPSSLITS